MYNNDYHYNERTSGELVSFAVYSSCITLSLQYHLALLIQLPPSLKITKGIENLRQYVVPELDDRFGYAVEVRDRTWFQDLAYNSPQG